MKDMLYKIPAGAVRGVFRFAGAFYLFPPTVRVESTNLCNARCTTCTRDIMTRPKGVMDMNLFKKIIDECGLHKIRSIHLHNFGEPLLDRGIFEKIRYASEKGLKTRLFSNLSILDDEKAKLLVESGLSRIKISIDGHSKETYENIRRGLSFDAVTENIENLIRTRDRLKTRTPEIGLTFVETLENTHEKEAFIRKWKKKVDSIDITSYHNWGGRLAGSKKGGPHGFPCLRLWATFTILWNGDAALCCMDYDGKVILGNVQEDSISSIFRGKMLGDIQHWHLNGRFEKIPICDKCFLRK